MDGGSGKALPAGSVITHYDTFAPLVRKCRGLSEAVPFHHPASVLRGPNIKGFGLYCLAAISTHRYAPLTFDPAPRDSRDDRDDVLDTAPALKKAVTAVTVVTLGEDPGSG